MKVRRLTLCFIIASAIVFGQGYYPIYAFHTKDETWFNSAGPDSLGLNTVLFSDVSYTKEQILAKLDAANNVGLKAIVGHARKGPGARNDLHWYCQLHKRVFQAEDASSFQTNFWNGDVIIDTFATNDTAFVIYRDEYIPCHMLKSVKDRTRFYEGSRTMDVIYHLKIDSLSLDTLTSNVKVCSLYITKDAQLVAQKVLTVGNFSVVNFYQPCSLAHSFEYVKTYYYGLYWFDNCDLYCDKIEAKDRYIDSLIQFPYYYNGVLNEITATYTGKPALAFYYLLDEPYEGYFAANGYILDYLNSEGAGHKPGIQTVWCDWNVSYYQKYMNGADPDSFFLINYYPLMGNSWNPPTPPESGSIFQGRLDDLCSALAAARKSTLQNSVKLWYLCQSFGMYDSVTGQTLGYREPTPRELRCMQWLALAYGVKSLGYFLYPTEKEKSGTTVWYDSGLVDQSTAPPRHRDSLWIPVQQMNFALKDIGAILLSLTSDTIFKSSSIPANNCYISYVSDTLVQIGTFYKTGDPNEKYFVIVNRHCLPSESLVVSVGINNSDSLFLWDCYSHQTIVPDSESGGNSFFSISLQPGSGKLLRLVPFASGFKINNNETYANMRFVALNTKAWSTETLDSMNIWQEYYDPPEVRHCDSTGWIKYDSGYVWYLGYGEGNNTVRIKYKVAGDIETPISSDTIYFDESQPADSFIINESDTFTNNSTVTIKNICTDIGSGMSKMRFGNQYLKNVVKNSDFHNTSYWQKDTVIYHDSLKLFEIPVETNGNYFYQSIPIDSLSDFYNDTLHLSLDLVSEGFIGNGKVQVQYIYLPDTVTLSDHPYGASITIPQGTNANVSQYNLSAYFKYLGSAPDEVRIGVFVYSNQANSGKLYIDNLRLDPVSPYNDYTRFSDYDSLKNWTLTSGNGVRKVYGQYADGAGNETGIFFDTIIVDTTKPARKITWPQNGQTISGTIEIKGWAYDYADPVQHFKQYELRYASTGQIDWYGVFPDSLKTTPVNQAFPPRRIGYWNTDSVTVQHGDGWYVLKLAVTDSADNQRDTSITVEIDNLGPGEGEMAGFSNYLYGLTAGSEIYIGEIQSGNIYKYDQEYQVLDTFALQDSAGIGYPMAMAFGTGKLWVANLTSQTINRYNNQGDLELRFTGNFSQPSGIALDCGGNIWVSDRLHHKIKKFSPAGESLFAFGVKGSDPGKINEPLGIALDNDRIYIADSKNQRVSVFDTKGNFIEIIGDSAGLSLPFDVAVDSTGCLFVSDVTNNRVVEFEPYGSILYEIDTLLDSPSCLALSPDDKILYVSDTKHKRVVAYQVRGEPPEGGGGPMGGEAALNLPFRFEYIYPNPAKNIVKIRFNSPDKRCIELKLYDATGRLVHQRMLSQVSVGVNEILIQAGELPSGIYFVMLDNGINKQIGKLIMLR